MKKFEIMEEIEKLSHEDKMEIHRWLQAKVISEMSEAMNKALGKRNEM